MKNKIITLALFLAVALGVGLVDVNGINAQTTLFPAGCSSALGYSATTGKPCNGTNNAIRGPLPGCFAAMGYSTINGLPCSGASFAIFFPAGCLTLNGYSSTTGKQCSWVMR